jgi:hypothetical protein
LHSLLNDRRPLTDRSAARDVGYGAGLEPQRAERSFQEAVVIPGIVAVRLATAVPPAKLLALIRRNLALVVIISSGRLRCYRSGRRARGRSRRTWGGT